MPRRWVMRFISERIRIGWPVRMTKSLRPFLILRVALGLAFATHDFEVITQISPLSTKAM